MSIDQIAHDQYNELVLKSVSTFGNYFRVRKALKKAEGSTVRIAFLGGSVTQGYNPAGMITDNYAELFCRYIKQKYCTAGDCVCVNEGIASVTTMHGLALTESRLMTVNPDIVFVEFAINNGMDRTYIASFESLIYKLLTMESNPAVIPIIVCNIDFYTCSGYMEMIAKYYDLPVVNVYYAIRFGIDNNVMKWTDYTNDYAHPTKDGHRLVADCMIRLFEEMSVKDSCYHIPETACYSREFYAFKFFDHNQLYPEENCVFVPSDTLKEFPAGWNYVKNGLCRSFRFRTECRALFVLYEHSNNMDYGMIEIWDNGSLNSSIEGYGMHAWGNPEIKLVINEAEAGIHQIDIRMCKSDVNKKFSLLGFGIVS